MENEKKEKSENNVESEKRPIMKISEILDCCPDNTTVEFFHSSGYIGMEIGVSRKGWGFGSITLSHNLEKGTWHLEDECTSREKVIQFLFDAIPHIVNTLYRKGDVKFEYKEDVGFVLVENPDSDEDASPALIHCNGCNCEIECLPCPFCGPKGDPGLSGKQEEINDDNK